MKFYIPYLDSLRSIAVLLVVGRHYDVSEYIPGGFGVTIFFFISGFLITTLLLMEESKLNSISLKSFYLRRVKRLSPPFFIFLLISVPIYTYLFELNFNPLQVVFGTVYLGNIHNILVDYQSWEYGIISYRILWSLAIEEHFYLFFPIFLIFVKNTERRVFYVFIGIIISLIFRFSNWIIFEDSESFNYHFTLTRMDSILFGVLLALNTKYWKGHREPIATTKVVMLIFLGLFVVFSSFLFRNDFFQDVLKFSVQGIGLYMIFYTLFAKHAFIKHFDLLDFKIMKFLGKISYEIYLWHYPVIHMVNIFYDGLAGIILALLMTILISHFSKQFVYFIMQRMKIN
jgi:peptidoglycan/LPS O-acetylase OafA/YrhL